MMLPSGPDMVHSKTMLKTLISTLNLFVASSWSLSNCSCFLTSWKCTLFPFSESWLPDRHAAHMKICCHPGVFSGNPLTSWIFLKELPFRCHFYLPLLPYWEQGCHVFSWQWPKKNQRCYAAFSGCRLSSPLGSMQEPPVIPASLVMCQFLLAF